MMKVHEQLTVEQVLDMLENVEVGDVEIAKLCDELVGRTPFDIYMDIVNTYDQFEDFYPLDNDGNQLLMICNNDIDLLIFKVNSSKYEASDEVVTIDELRNFHSYPTLEWLVNVKFEELLIEYISVVF